MNKEIIQNVICIQKIQKDRQYPQKSKKTDSSAEVIVKKSRYEDNQDEPTKELPPARDPLELCFKYINTLEDELHLWSERHNITAEQFTDLLKVLKEFGVDYLPEQNSNDPQPASSPKPTDTLQQNSNLVDGVDDKPPDVLEKLNTLELTVQELNDKLQSISNNMVIKNDYHSQNRIIRENLVLTKELIRATERLFGPVKSEHEADIISRLPLLSMEELEDMDERLEDFEYMAAMKSYLFKKKGPHGDVNTLFREIINDECCIHYNWDGRAGKSALRHHKIFEEPFFEAFPGVPHKDIEKQLRTSIEKSHNRHKQMNFRKNQNFK